MKTRQYVKQVRWEELHDTVHDNRGSLLLTHRFLYIQQTSCKSNDRKWVNTLVTANLCASKTTRQSQGNQKKETGVEKIVNT